ncbi:hypothetical protein [Methylomagnum sp.]
MEKPALFGAAAARRPAVVQSRRKSPLQALTGAASSGYSLN